MEPFSVAAAAITLGPIIIHTARKLRKVAKSIKYARRELKDLTEEMDIFSTIYDGFIQVTEKRMERTKSASSARKRLISWAEHAKSDFEKLSQRVDALSQDPLYEHSFAATVSAHWKWYFSKSHLKYLRYTLVVARQSMVGFTHMYRIEKLDELLAELRSVTSDKRTLMEKKYGMTLEKYIKLLKAKKKQLRDQTAFTSEIAQEAIEKISSKQSRNQNEDYSTHTEQLLSFSRAVDRNIERTLHPSSRSSQKSSSFSSSPPSSANSPSNATSPSSASSRSIKGSCRVDSPSQSSGLDIHIQPSHSAVDELRDEARLRIEAERIEAERIEAERIEAERIEAERLEAERLEAKKLEVERTKAYIFEAAKLEAERTEAAKLEAERLEAERLEAKKLEAERTKADILKAKRLAAQGLKAGRIRHDIARQRSETKTTRIDPNHIPPLSVPNCINDTDPLKPRTDTEIRASIEPSEAPQVQRSETVKGEDGSNNGERSESEMEEEEEEEEEEGEEVASDQATHTGNSKWRATGAFPGTEPRSLREKRLRDS